MNFRTMTVKECFDNPKCVEIIKSKAPNLMKYPIKLFNKKTCGEIFDLVVSKKIVPESIAKEIEAAIKKILVGEFEVDPARLTPDVDLFAELDLDSIDAVDLVVRLQQETGKKVEPAEFKKLRTFGDVVAAVSKLVNG